MAKSRIITSKIPALTDGQRLDSYCADRFTYLSLDQWQKEISAGKITLNGIAATDATTPLKGGETLAWDASDLVEPDVDKAVTILFEDEGFVAVDKTGNLPVHPSGRYFNHTLVALLEHRFDRKVYPVHRLDRETSGVMILAFSGKVAGLLSEALSSGSKEYLALVHGTFPDAEMRIDLPLGRDPESAITKKRKAWPGGSEAAITRFRKIHASKTVSLVRCFPETGRLHQIRAHLLAAGYPIVGDKLYGRDENAFLDFIRNGLTDELKKRLLLPRQALHAACLKFRHPETQKDIILRAPLPEMFAAFMRTAPPQATETV